MKRLMCAVMAVSVLVINCGGDSDSAGKGSPKNVEKSWKGLMASAAKYQAKLDKPAEKMEKAQQEFDQEAYTKAEKEYEAAAKAGETALAKIVEGCTIAIPVEQQSPKSIVDITGAKICEISWDKYQKAYLAKINFDYTRGEAAKKLEHLTLDLIDTDGSTITTFGLMLLEKNEKFGTGIPMSDKYADLAKLVFVEKD